MELDLSSYRGQVVQLRFLWLAAVDDTVQYWRLARVEVTDRMPMTAPPTTTVTDEPLAPGATTIPDSTATETTPAIETLSQAPAVTAVATSEN